VQEHVGTRNSTQSRSHAQKFFKKVGVEHVRDELIRLKGKADVVEMSINLNSLKNSDANEDESDSDSEILIWIDDWNTPHPKLRNPLTGFEKEKTSKNKAEEVLHSKSEQCVKAFLIPDSSQTSKSRSNSEKSLVEKSSLALKKNESDFSAVTQATSQAQLKLVPVTDVKLLELTNASVPFTENDRNNDFKDMHPIDFENGLYEDQEHKLEEGPYQDFGIYPDFSAKAEEKEMEFEHMDAPPEVARDNKFNKMDLINYSEDENAGLFGNKYEENFGEISLNNDFEEFGFNP